MEQVDELTLEQMAFMMILHSGNARSTIQEAIQLYKTSSYETF
ncbi:MAG: PTS lactose/cellobiose transporter subunit IIA, partial [Exiguobacterium sp.]|nr:PTS lactose/cellobiose transporter subunit IIA [Exiguobacterium sp.]